MSNHKPPIRNHNQRKPPAGKKPGNGPSPRSRAPESTLEEVRYLKYLIDNEIPVRVRLRDNSEVSGTIEYYDLSFIRLTCSNGPNLFIYKSNIKYIYEDTVE